MSRLQTQALALDHAAEYEERVRRPRAVEGADAAIGSPVHDLHEQLELFEAPLGDAEPFATTRSDKAPGWARLTLPVMLSMALWGVILSLTGVIG